MLIKIFLITILFVSAYLLLEFIKRRLILHTIITRKIAHTVSIFVALGLSFFLTKEEFILITALVLCFFIFSYSRNILSAIHIKSPKTYGEIYLPVAIIFMSIFFYNDLFVFWTSLLVLAISDTLTGLYHFYRHQYKSLCGSGLFFLSTLLIVFFCISILAPISFDIYTLIKIVLISLAVTGIEYISTAGTDNLTIPILLSTLLFLFF